jgi:hypothetical protein
MIDLGKISITIEGAYSTTTNYERLSIVNLNGSSYISKVDNNLNNPLNDVNFWEIIAEKGDSIDEVGADDVTETATRVFVTPSEKTAITHSNRSILDAITESFTTALKTDYDGAVTWITTNETNILNHLASTSNPHSVTKAQVGLSNVVNADTTTTANITDSTNKRFVTDSNLTTIGNTSGTNSGDETTATIQTKRPLKTIEGQSLEGSGNIDLSKSDVGLSNVDNTTDLNKPISTATQTALNNKWGLNGNSATSQATNFLGTTDNVGLSFRTNNVIRQTIDNTGNVGIGTTTPTSNIHINGSEAGTISNITATTTLNATQHKIVVSNGATAITITFPDALTCLGREYIISRAAGSTGAITLQRTGTNTIQAFNGTTGATSSIGAHSAAGAGLRHSFTAINVGGIGVWVRI